MRLPILTVAAVAAVLVGCSTTNRDLLSMRCPDDWTIEYKNHGGLDFYTVTARTADRGLLMFSGWPVPSRVQNLHSLVEEQAESFREEAKTSSEMSLASDDPKIEHFAGAHCEGSYAVFHIRSNGTNEVQVLFMMSVEDRIWDGNFIGRSEATWKEALDVLKSAKKSG